ncbi:hypothetical protein QBC42DRAFT_250722 [Cladorrhinum samala]|uniref:Uncharacterized protein n=1 Tax=Cladorrhinum samala TaxID=585594 RepID=A0AAV9HTN7_9PEZI|nr:hypothetical protein QBC42DRAFT_250722 [Cladorrhinum samala]
MGNFSNPNPVYINGKPIIPEPPFSTENLTRSPGRSRPSPKSSKSDKDAGGKPISRSQNHENTRSIDKSSASHSKPSKDTDTKFRTNRTESTNVTTKVSTASLSSDRNIAPPPPPPPPTNRKPPLHVTETPQRPVMKDDKFQHRRRHQDVPRSCLKQLSTQATSHKLKRQVSFELEQMCKLCTRKFRGLLQEQIPLCEKCAGRVEHLHWDHQKNSSRRS